MDEHANERQPTATRGLVGFPRLTVNPAVMGGKVCVRGMRVTVGMILGNLGEGVAIDEFLAAYPYLERDDVLEALRYGSWLAQEREIHVASAAG
jgi:uncharacterized protein (DUF433 family)